MPFVVFLPMLAATSRQGLLECGVLATRYHNCSLGKRCEAKNLRAQNSWASATSNLLPISEIAWTDRKHEIVADHWLRTRRTFDAPRPAARSLRYRSSAGCIINNVRV